MKTQTKSIQKKTRIRSRDLFRFFTQYTSGYDTLIHLSVCILIIFGFLMIASANVGLGENLLGIVMKQIIYIVIGYIFSCLCNRLFTFSRYHSIQNILLSMLWILMGLAASTEAINGTKAWLSLGNFSLQPSEFAKLFAILVVADSIYVAKKKPKKTWYDLYSFPLFSFLVVNIIMLFQKDWGTFFVINFVYFICVLVPELHILKKFKRFMVAIFTSFIIVCIALCALFYYQKDILQGTGLDHIPVRIHNTFNPYDDLYNTGYQPANALYGMGNSDFFGKGFGNSTRKYGYLTQVDTDYIFALIIEETGIFGLMIIGVCYVIILWRLFYYAIRCSDPCSRIVIVGNIGYIFIHFFLNIGGVSCLVPLTGIPLLFVSRGGSSLISIMISMGICQKIISTVGKKNSRISV
ncbi:MAG: FtsW/RodA/SpoVE family cell cycle protein [Bacillota bacterium]|nr:FtsW/RodA/SpoVE family cell cycle protein [Bacillota bacterium]